MSIQAGDVWVVDDTLEIEPGQPVFYFDLAPVLARSAESVRHPERLKLMCEQCIERNAPHELVAFKDTGFFLIVRSCKGDAADFIAKAIDIALLKRFFGTECMSSIDMPPIFRSVDTSDLTQAGFTVVPSASKPVAAPALVRKMPVRKDEAMGDPLLHLAQSGVPGYDGLRLGYMPIYNLRRNAASVFACRPVRQKNGHDFFDAGALNSIDTKDRPSLDQAMLEYCLSFVNRVVPTKGAAAIGTSVSFETLAWSRGRQLYQYALRSANAANNPFLIVKIDNVPTGTPVNRLAEIVSTVRPLVKRIFLELPNCESGLMQSGIIGVAGLSTVLPANASSATTARICSWLNKTATVQQALPCIEGIEHQSNLNVVRSTGIRFAAGPFCDGGHVLNAPPLDGREIMLHKEQALACA